MRYYKRIKDSERNLNFNNFYQKGKIYEGSHKRPGASFTLQESDGELIEEVPAGDYFVQENILPGCFRVKMIKHPLREKYVEWWKNEFNSKFYYEGKLGRFYGFNSYDRTNMLNADINGNLPENTIELTLEQWNKIINKKEVMKEIIGYKAPYSLFGGYVKKDDVFKLYGDSYRASTNNGQLVGSFLPKEIVETWEPVYKQETPDIKIGDYIYMINACGAKKEYLSKYNGDVLKVTSFKKENNNLFPDAYWLKHTPGSFSGGGFSVDESAWEYGVHFRKATTEEIKKATTLTFGGYDVTFEKVSSGVRITCNGETGTLSQMQKIFDFITGFPTFKFGSQRLEKIEFPNVNVHLDNLTEKPLNIQIGCIYGTWEEFCNILEAAKKLENE